MKKVLAVSFLLLLGACQPQSQAWLYTTTSQSPGQTVVTVTPITGDRVGK